MIRSNEYFHKEYIYPNERFKGFWLRIILSILALALLIYIYVRVLLIGELAFLMILLAISIIFTLLIIWIVRDFILFMRSSSLSYKVRARLVISNLDIKILVGKREIKKMKWEEVDIIEKTIYHEERVILLIRNILNEKHIKCYGRLNNYIMIPHRFSIDNAIRKFSMRRIEIASPDMDRFSK